MESSTSKISTEIRNWTNARKRIKAEKKKYKKAVKPYKEAKKESGSFLVEAAKVLFEKMLAINKTYNLSCYANFHPCIGFHCCEGNSVSLGCEVLRVLKITNEFVDFRVREHWRWEGYSYGVASVPINYLDRDLSDMSWYHELCKAEITRRKQMNADQKRRQIAKLQEELDALGVGEDGDS